MDLKAEIVRVIGTLAKKYSTPPVRYSISSDLLSAHLSAVNFSLLPKATIKRQSLQLMQQGELPFDQDRIQLLHYQLSRETIPVQFEESGFCCHQYGKGNAGVECVSLVEYKSNNMGNTQHLHSYCQLCTKVR